jgi:hypothetical protein
MDASCLCKRVQDAIPESKLEVEYEHGGMVPAPGLELQLYGDQAIRRQELCTIEQITGLTLQLKSEWVECGTDENCYAGYTIVFGPCVADAKAARIAQLKSELAILQLPK